MRNAIVGILLGAVTVMAHENSNLSGAGVNPEIDQLTFRNTSAWGKEFSEWLRKPVRYLPVDWKERIQLAPPPANSSARTQAELEAMLTLKQERGNRQAAIEKEIEITNFRFGDHLYGDLTSKSEFARTGELLRSAYLDVGVAIFHFKNRHDRVRPSVLAQTIEMDLESSIEIPGHPAYPSGHATGAYALAYLLQELDPKNAERYLADARRIGVNREVAGVHYASDTEAGRLLARQLVDAILEHSAFRSQLEQARTEW